MKKLLKITTMTLIGIVLGINIGLQAGKENVVVAQDTQEKITLDYTWVQEGNVQELENFYLQDGDMLTMLSDGSYALMNKQENLYSFQPIDLGDWDYEVENEQQLENLIKTYISIKNTGGY